MLLYNSKDKVWYYYYCLLSPQEPTKTALQWEKFKWPVDVSFGFLLYNPTEEKLAKYEKYISLLKSVWEFEDISDDPKFVTKTIRHSKNCLLKALVFKNITSYKELCVVFNLFKFWEKDGDFLQPVEKNVTDVLESVETLFQHFKYLGELSKKDYYVWEKTLLTKRMPMYNFSEFSVHALKAKSFAQMRKAFLNGWANKNPHEFGWSAA